MIRDLFKWVVPGLATVLGGTSLCLAMTSGDIASDLSARSADLVQASGFDWAELSLDMRDISLSGTTTSQSLVDDAATRLAALSGVRSVTANVTLAPLAAPYRLDAALKDGVTTVAGAVPDDTTRQLLLPDSGVEQGTLEVRSGMPERRLWIAGAQFALEQLQYLDQGAVTLSDLTVSLNGRAKSERAFRDLLLAMRAGPPDGVTLGDVEITPALVAPYQWHAVSNGKQIEVSGFVPDEALIERFRTAEISGLPIATGLALGSGEQSGFAELSQTLIEQLSKLEYGTASIIDGVSTITGAPATIEIAQAVVESLQPSGSIVVLDPPRIDDYWVSATLQPGGVIVFDGYAPDEATRAALGQRNGADVNWLKLGRGAPERYQSAVDFGLAALARMSEGRFALRGNVITLSGVARSGTDFDALAASTAEAAPQGLVLAPAEIAPPRAAQFQWTASKSASGHIALTGMVPTPDAKATLDAAAGEKSADTTVYASGEPNNFVAAAQIGLGLLQWVGEGSVSYDGSGWLVAGTANSMIDKGAIEAEFLSRQLAAAGWSMAVADPVQAIATPAPVPAVEPVAPEIVAAEAPPATAEVPQVDPSYAFSATRNQDGAVILSGQLPANSALSFLSTISSGDTEAVSIADGAPETFLASAEIGVRALLLLDEGQLNFANGGWSISGTAEDSATRDKISASIAADTANSWTVSIEVPAPVAEPVAVPTPATPSQPAAKVDIAACRTPIADFSARNAILFQSGAAIIAAESQPAIDELATDLGSCPDAVVRIEGHTDADGDEQLNLALSVARAEAVVEALVARGVTPARLYAVGFGESAPIADNDTSAGKRLNRRIVVTVSDEHY